MWNNLLFNYEICSLPLNSLFTVYTQNLMLEFICVSFAAKYFLFSFRSFFFFLFECFFSFFLVCSFGRKTIYIYIYYSLNFLCLNFVFSLFLCIHLVHIYVCFNLVSTDEPNSSSVNKKNQKKNHTFPYSYMILVAGTNSVRESRHWNLCIYIYLQIPMRTFMRSHSHIQIKLLACLLTVYHSINRNMQQHAQFSKRTLSELILTRKQKRSFSL